ncbi:MAG TPA: hypothetical protein VGC90_11210 [Candidatus Limnocylindrales bacterium]
MTLKVVAVIEPVLVALGGEADPHCWVAWGDDPGVRYTIFVPLPPGLVACTVRVNAPGEGPRASAKLVRWGRVQVGEMVVETQAGHRVATFQLEQQVLRAADAHADRITRFGLAVLAAIDGRPAPDLGDGRSRRGPVKAKSGKGPVAGAAAKAGGASRASSARSRTRAEPTSGSEPTPRSSGLTVVPSGRTKQA